MDTAVSKGEFAALIGVSPGRISQYLSEGKISAAAMQGHGRSARIFVEKAKADLRLTRDVSQSLGNGLDTRLDPEPASADHGFPFDRSPPAGYPKDPPDTPPAPNIDMKLKLAKLEQAERANRNAAIEDEKERGRFTETSEATKAMGRIASSMLDIFEGGLTDMATAISAAFKLPERDVKHLIRQEFRKVRENAARQMRMKAIELPEFLESELVTEDAEADGL
jgi:hypothetical protein